MWNNIYPNNCLTEWKGQWQLALSWWYSNVILSPPVLGCRDTRLLIHSGLWMSLQSLQDQDSFQIIYYCCDMCTYFIWVNESRVRLGHGILLCLTHYHLNSACSDFFLLERVSGLCYMVDIVFYSSIHPCQIQFLLFLRCSLSWTPVPCLR